MPDKTSTRSRLVVIGTDELNRSTVVSDAPVRARADRPKDAYPNLKSRQAAEGASPEVVESDYWVEELWRVDRVPADPGPDGSDVMSVDKYAPPGGVSVRKLSLPPTGEHMGEPDYEALHLEFGANNVSSPEEGLPVLHRHPCLHVITFVSGACYFVLRTGEVLLEAGDTVVLRGDVHDWRNPFDEPAVILATILPLAESADT
jgi:mannose-6-phosphate isomerase-like protein (cupin superfamily)